MRFINLLGIVLSLFSFLNTGKSICAQDLSEHLWKNRLLIVLSDAKDSDLVRKQMQTLHKDIHGLEERKLVIYQATKKEYKEGFKSGIWRPSEKLYKKYNKSGNPFYVVLIGLDGSVKLTKSTLLQIDELYSKIDSMPMRKNELNSR